MTKIQKSLKHLNLEFWIYFGFRLPAGRQGFSA